MTYRNFIPPGASSTWNVGHWIDWMHHQGDILIPVAPRHDEGCERCFGASTYRDDGSTWPRCWNCGVYGSAIDSFLPASYSVDSGLESMLHAFKDRGAGWLGAPLASLLATFVRRHADCIDRDAGGVDVATFIPSDNTSRSFDHLDVLLRTVTGGADGGRFNWLPDAVVRNPSTARPRRGELKPAAYEVRRPEVRGASVLLLDDTWTSGSSAASTAAALKESGAAHVTVLTLGRQLNSSNHFGSTETIQADRSSKMWTSDACVLCT